ncbi:hypothetical protein BJX66DRAFT_127263 [Aspergillus keveii]|uniref:C2H2-type domain-containing protein n=1 Tax=Aspergillus keveii TaxID=714993 RepID=A0ABR4FJT5_9EURO
MNTIGPYLVQKPTILDIPSPGPTTAHACTLCSRFFVSQSALYSHFRFSTQHEWCEKCSRVFVPTAARDAHFRESSRHNICPTCGRLQDFDTPAELARHLEEFHFCCTSCSPYVYHDSPEELRRHDVAQHNLCIKCGDYFGNANNLLMHQQRHQPRTMRCYGCDHTFKSFSGMLIHLESGACASQMTEDQIDALAHRCYQSRKYVLRGLDGGEGWMYKCPTCYREFMKLSALYQHAEDVMDCGHGCLDKLQVWIAKCV